MITKGLMSSNTDEWATPKALFKQLDDKYHFDIDVCATPENAKCEKYYTKEEDGLSQEWQGRCFMNPPYGREIPKWVAKAYESVYRGGAELVCCVVPSRTDTRWWHDYCMKGEITFIKGRLKFNDGDKPAPFPSAIVVFKRGE